MWVDIREPHTGKLLARYEPTRSLLEFAQRGVKTLVDLTQYETHTAPASAQPERQKGAPE